MSAERFNNKDSGRYLTYAPVEETDKIETSTTEYRGETIIREIVYYEKGGIKRKWFNRGIEYSRLSIVKQIIDARLK